MNDDPFAIGNAGAAAAAGTEDDEFDAHATAANSATSDAAMTKQKR